MSWLQRIAGDWSDFDDDDNPWSYDDYRRFNKFRPDSYMSIGHEDANTILFTVMSDFRLKEISPEELAKVEYENRNHNILNPSLHDELANGRIEGETKKGSISLVGISNRTNSFKLRVLNIIFNHYSGVDFYVWDGEVSRIPLLTYWRMLDE